MSIKKARALGIKVANVLRTTYSVAEHAGLTIGIKSKDYSRSKLMQMGDYRDHLVGFDLHGKSRNYWNRENRRRFCKIMHGFGCQILACDPENKELIQQIDITYTQRGL
jgi:D-lactate dehydrogenase